MYETKLKTSFPLFPQNRICKKIKKLNHSFQDRYDLFEIILEIKFQLMHEHLETSKQIIQRLTEAKELIDGDKDIDKFTKYVVLTTIEEAILHIDDLSKQVTS